MLFRAKMEKSEERDEKLIIAFVNILSSRGAFVLL